MKTVLNYWKSTLTSHQEGKKASKIHVLARIAKYMDINKRRMFMKALVSVSLLPSNMDFP